MFEIGAPCGNDRGIRLTPVRLVALQLSAVLPLDTTLLAPSKAQDRVAEIESLRTEVQRHDALYFREAAPVIGDAEYDRLTQKLERLQQEFAPSGFAPEFVDELSLPHDDRSGQHRHATHRVPMLSLSKCHNESDLHAFYNHVAGVLGADDVCCVVEPKYDGVAISLTYEHGRFTRAATRGDGMEGDDVTENVRAIRGLPEVLRSANGRVPDLIELRGEVYLPLSGFARLNRERDAVGDDPLASPRNVAAGTLKQMDPRLMTERGLALVTYGMGACDPAAVAPESQQELHRRIAEWGLPGVRQFAVTNSAEELSRTVSEFRSQSAALDAPTDGVVIKVDLFGARTALGSARHFPRWATAYKFTPERAETRLRGIQLRIGRTGVLTPVADLEPVRLGGALVSSATLHSVGEIWRRDIRVGDIVEVERSGEVIPVIAAIHAERRAPSSEKYTPPTECPACAGPLVVESNGAVLRCPNPRCTQQLIRQLQHFISDEGVAMQGLGRDAIARMVRSGCVHTVADLYRLTPDRLELALPESTASTRARWVGAITGSKHADLWRFISGLGIPHVGISAAKALARRFPDLPSLAHAATSGDAFDGIGRETVASLAAYFSEAENRAMIAELAALGVKAASSTQPSDSRSLADSSHRRTYPDGKDQAAGLIPDRSRSAPFEGETGVERIVGRQGRIPAPRSAQFW